ncbi:sulfite exporter TauE/SafE family protein [Alkalilacustris brevis]|uniref:sulfite exporter TauE/SafE family protein n=1 Tax=Alkalilacustris brevis TaxID=2026338 RepID=UPI000E0DFB43|nr:sulfite exporter TauE/SafE family protein [Alkalilacustris brevis]
MDILGVTVFGDLAPAQMAGLVAVYVIAFLLKGVFGYGAVSMMVVGSALIIPPHQAVVLAAVTNFYTQIQLIPRSLRDGDRQVAGKLIIWTLPSVVAGVWLFASLEARWLSLAIGLFILFLVISEVFGLIGRMAPLVQRHTAVAGPIASTVAGLIGGFLGAGAMVFISVYVRMLCAEKMLFRGTMILVGTIFIVWRFSVLLVGGIIGIPVLMEAAILAPICFMASHIGIKLVSHIPNALFFRLYQGILILAALMLVYQTLTG